MSEKVLTADEVAAMRTQATASWRIIAKSDTYRHNDVPSLARNVPQNVARIETLGASHEALRALATELAEALDGVLADIGTTTDTDEALLAEAREAGVLQ